MITSQGWIEPTRAIGLVAYATASACCGIAWIRTRARADVARLAAILTLIEFALLMDMAFNWRWKLHQLLMDVAMQKHEYGQRSLPQLVTVSLLGAVFLAAITFAKRSLRGRGTTLLAVSGTIVSVVMWCIEVVSLHAMDHVLYCSIVGVRAVSALWILSCTMTSIAILLDPR